MEAALLWTIAGGILLWRGSTMLTASSGFSWFRIMACIGGGLIFFVFVFSRISFNHVDRIIHLPGKRHWFYEFFNSKSYIMMFSMISLGIFLRRTSIVPIASLSLAYITMGIPLLLSSIRFYHRWYCYFSLIDSSIT